MRFRALLAAGLVVSTLPHAPLLAQAPAERAMIDAFRDTLGALHDPAAALAVVQREKDARPAGDDQLQRLRYGWALNRLGELADSAPPLIDAMLQFYEAGVRRGKWTYPPFGMGATKLALDDINAAEVRSVHQSAGSGWRFGAADAFLTSVQKDTNYITAAVELGLTVMRTPTWVRLDPVISALTRAARSGRAGNDIWLVLGRLQRQIDSNRAALRSFETYVSLPGADISQGQLERARTLFALGEAAEGTQAYYAGAQDASAEARAMYRKDIGWIADSTELKTFDSTSSDGLGGFLGRFWRDRETVSGRAPGSRIAEHYRRWGIAQRLYKLQPQYHQQWDFGQIQRTANSEVDDRGMVFIRHGEPDDRASFVADGVPPNESWVYHHPGEDLIVHFAQSLTASGWNLVDGITQLGASPCQIPALLDSRGAIDPTYQRFADAARQDSFNLAMAARGGDRQAVRFFEACIPGRLSRGQTVAAVIAAAASGASLHYFDTHSQDEERLANTRQIRRVSTTDSDPLRFRAQIQPRIQAYGVGGPRPGVGRLLIVWAILGSDHPRADTIPGVTGVVYSVRIRANVTDSTGRLVVGIDSVKRYHYGAGTLPDNGLLSQLITLDVPAGTYRVQLSIADTIGDKGALRVAGGIPVPAFTGPTEMSDLVLGMEGSSLVWNRGGTPFPLNPRNAWTTAETMTIGFELGGLAAGTSYKVRIGISDLGADSTAPAKASVEFENQASGTRELVSQSLGLRALRPGRYLLTATVTTPNGVLHRDRRITIVATQ